MTQANILIYGSYGYTGELIVRLAVERQIPVILSGRNAEKLAAQSSATGMENRPFSLDDEPAAIAALQGVDVVIHCAGPFAHTYQAMAALCLKTGTHYTDITGETEVFAGLALLDEQARSAGVMLLPGTGFDVVPSDCLANHVHQRLPDATHLELAFRGVGGGVSHGTATTMAENIASGGQARIAGGLQSVPTAWKARSIAYCDGESVASMTIPWGDVVTAGHSTGIDNIHVFTPVPTAAIWLLRLTRSLHWLMGLGLVQSAIKNRIDAAPAGPSDAQRGRAHSELWAEARNAAGKTVQSRLRTLEGYTLTAEAALAIVLKIAAGEFIAGFQTPAGVYGKDLILAFGESKFEDLS